MFRSVRFRLALSYVLLTVLVAAVISGLGLFLVQRYASQEELQRLTSSAQSVAQQAASMLDGARRDDQLQELARTASFLSDARVQILGAQGEVIADSEIRASHYVWLLSSPERSTGRTGQGGGMPLFVVPDSERPLPTPHLQWMGRSGVELPPDAMLTLVRWRSGTWGSSLEIEGGPPAGQVREPVRSGRDVARSDRVVRESIDPKRTPSTGMRDKNGTPRLMSFSFFSRRPAMTTVSP